MPTTVLPDEEAPEIFGVRDLQVEAGDEIDFLEGISVTDNADVCPSLQVDTNNVFLDRPGVYMVVYSAWDAAGNESQRTCWVTVTE